MKEELITVKTAKLARVKGFDIVCDRGYYLHGSEDSNVELLLWVSGEQDEPEFGYAPTQSLLQRWLREKYNCEIEIIIHTHGDLEDQIVKCKEDKLWEVCVNYYGANFEMPVEGTEDDFNEAFLNTYEEALELGLQEGLKLIK